MQDMNMNNQSVMSELRTSIEKFLFRFDELVEKYGLVPSYKALRRQYRDTCCFGDYLINEVLDGLISKDTQYYVKFMEEHKEDAAEIKRLIDDYVMDTLDKLDEHQLELEVFY